jgi:hypothetical protein
MEQQDLKSDALNASNISNEDEYTSNYSFHSHNEI